MSDLKCHCGAVAMPGEVVCFVHTAQYLSTGAGQRVAESVTRMRDRPLETIEKVKRLMDDNAIAPRTADEIIMSDDDTARMTASKIISGQEERKAGRAAFKAAQLEEALYDEVEAMKAKFTARIAELEAHSAARDRTYDILSKALDSYKAKVKRLEAEVTGAANFREQVIGVIHDYAARFSTGSNVRQKAAKQIEDAVRRIPLAVRRSTGEQT